MVVTHSAGENIPRDQRRHDPNPKAGRKPLVCPTFEIEAILILSPYVSFAQQLNFWHLLPRIGISFFKNEKHA